MIDPDDVRATAFELAARALVKRAATDPAISEDGVQRALEELWTGPVEAYVDPLTGHYDVDRLRRVAALRAQSRTIDEWRRACPESLDAPVSNGVEETRGSRVVAPDERLAERLDGEAALAEIGRRSQEASRGVRVGLQAIRCREAGYSDEEIAVAFGLSQAHVRQLICRARAWARRPDPRLHLQGALGSWPQAG